MSKTRTITPNPPADFMPEHQNIKPFRAWCQKVLPLVYDDSLSYYELLCKVLDVLNKTALEVINLGEAYDKLEDYVNHYFDNLDIQEEINNKLDEMFQNGELQELINEYFTKYMYYITPECKGAKGDGVTDDTEAINNAISYCVENGLALVFKTKKYLISGDISFSGINIDLNRAEIIGNNNTLTIGANASLTNGTLTKINLISNGEFNITVRKIVIQNWSGVGFTINGNGYQSCYEYIVFWRTESSAEMSTGLLINAADCRVSHIYGNGAFYGIVTKSKNCYITDAHLWLNNNNIYKGSIFITANQNVVLTNCCSDTYNTVIKTLNFIPVTLTNLNVINNNILYNNFTLKLIDGGNFFVTGNCYVYGTDFVSNNINVDYGSGHSVLFTTVDYPNKAINRLDYNSIPVDEGVTLYSLSNAINTGKEIHINIAGFVNGELKSFNIDISKLFGIKDVGTLTFVGTGRVNTSTGIKVEQINYTIVNGKLQVYLLESILPDSTIASFNIDVTIPLYYY